jgi:hypothetical protein
VIKLIVAATMALAASACNRVDYTPYRDRIKAQLRDPSSAEFQKETIRTLWSKEGGRLKLYCAMVNSNNAFGGKSGFVPAQVIIYSKQSVPDDITAEVYKAGSIQILSVESISNYLNCVRPDTERHGDEMFKAYVMTGPWDDNTGPAQADKLTPIISSDKAPEER